MEVRFRLVLMGSAPRRTSRPPIAPPVPVVARSFAADCTNATRRRPASLTDARLGARRIVTRRRSHVPREVAASAHCGEKVPDTLPRMKLHEVLQGVPLSEAS